MIPHIAPESCPRAYVFIFFTRFVSPLLHWQDNAQSHSPAPNPGLPLSLDSAPRACLLKDAISKGVSKPYPAALKTLHDILEVCPPTHVLHEDAILRRRRQ